jgi:hypothetical protein
MDISAIGRQFGLNDEQTRAAFDALAPVVAAGVRRSAQSPQGLQDIFRTVLTGGDDATLGDPDAVQFERAKPRGDDILGQIFGSKDVSRGVAQQLSASSGVGAAILKQLLPIVASMVLGKLAKGFGGGVAQATPAPGGGGGLGDILKDIFGGGATSAPAPQQRAPQPMPSPGTSPSGQGTGNPLEDMLNDILAGGQNGRVVMKQIPPEQMGEILRDIFGGGFPGGLPGGQGGPGRQGGSAGGSGDWRPSEEAVTRGRKTLDDALGGGTKSGNDADILLDSVDKAIRRGG